MCLDWCATRVATAAARKASTTMQYACHELGHHRLHYDGYHAALEDSDFAFFSECSSIAHEVVKAVFQLLQRIDCRPALEQLTSAIRSVVTKAADRWMGSRKFYRGDPETWWRQFCLSWATLAIDFAGPTEVDAQFQALVNDIAANKKPNLFGDWDQDVA